MPVNWSMVGQSRFTKQRNAARAESCFVRTPHGRTTTKVQKSPKGRRRCIMKSMMTFAAVVAVLSMSTSAQAGLFGKLKGCGASKCCDCAPTFEPQVCKPTIVRPCHTNIYNYQRSCAKPMACDTCAPTNGCAPCGDAGAGACAPGAGACAPGAAACAPGANACAAPGAGACAPGAAACAPGADACAAPCGNGCAPGAAACAAPCGNGCAPAGAGCAAPCDPGCGAPCDNGCAPADPGCGAPCDPGCGAPCDNACAPAVECCPTVDVCEIAQLFYESQTACYAKHRRRAIHRLGDRYSCVCNPEIMAAFIYALNDADERVREKAADEIGDQLRKNPCCCSSCVVAALTNALADCDRGVRRQAEQALEACGYEIVDGCCEVACDTGCTANGCAPAGCSPAAAPAAPMEAAPKSEGKAPAPAPPEEPKAYFPKRLPAQEARPISARTSLSNLPIQHALVPVDSDAARRISAPNYDEFQSDREVWELLQQEPESVLRVTMAHCHVADLASAPAEGGPEALAHSSSEMQSLVESPRMRRIDGLLWVYEITSPKRSDAPQLGVGGFAATNEIRTESNPDGVIVRNEGIRPEKADGRARLIEATNAYIGTVNLAVSDKSGGLTSELVRISTSQACDYETVDEAGNRHRVWLVTESSEQDQIIKLLAAEPAAYVADGNHRSAAAAQLGKENFLAVFFPTERLGLEPYNRLLPLSDISSDAFLSELEGSFEVERLGTLEEGFRPNGIHEIGGYVQGAWYRLLPKPGSYDENDAAGSIDADIVQQQIIAKILKIEDARDKRINYVGGNKDASYLQARVDSGEFDVAISLAPVTMDQFVAVCEQNQFMPPKSTWFDPKIRSGLVVALLDE
ncbi:Uncharacterized protein SCF082_LOCUS833 [Durusdinium trenchii]|uniref:DUF1015 domain-containing protein n=1 Tax=Durusdinium trenchii TaxID=1381693 RepID=A0ABP0HD64_9DINO